MLGEHETGGGGGWESVRFCSPLRCVVRRQSFPKRGRTRPELKAPRVVACVREESCDLRVVGLRARNCFPDVEPLFWFSAHQALANEMSGGAAGAAQAKPVKEKTCWKTKFAEEYAAADARVGRYTKEFTVAKLKTMKLEARSVAHRTLVKAIGKMLPDAWRTSKYNSADKPEWTAADAFVKKSLTRWRLKLGQGASYTSKNAIAGEERYNESAHNMQERIKYKAGTLVLDQTFKIRIGQVCLLTCYS
jgi:hypothetical protein